MCVFAPNDEWQAVKLSMRSLLRIKYTKRCSLLARSSSHSSVTESSRRTTTAHITATGKGRRNEFIYFWKVFLSVRLSFDFTNDQFSSRQRTANLRTEMFKLNVRNRRISDADKDEECIFITQQWNDWVFSLPIQSTYCLCGSSGAQKILDNTRRSLNDKQNDKQRRNRKRAKQNEFTSNA